MVQETLLRTWQVGCADARVHSAGVEPDAVLALRLGMKLNAFLQSFTRARGLPADCCARQRGVRGVVMTERERDAQSRRRRARFG